MSVCVCVCVYILLFVAQSPKVAEYTECFSAER